MKPTYKTELAFIERVFKSTTHDNLVLYRNASFGAAAVCIATLVSLTQIGAATVAIQVAVLAASIGAPLWLLVGSLVEHYVVLGQSSYAHFDRMLKRPPSFVLVALAYVSSVCSLAAVIFYLMPAAMWAFLVCGFGTFLYGRWFMSDIARWYTESAEAESQQHQ